VVYLHDNGEPTFNGPWVLVNGEKITMNQAIGLHNTIQRADDLVSCDLDGETALMSAVNGKYYGLNPVGSRIWSLLEQARLVADICAFLRQEFKVGSSQCQHDVLFFLNELARDNLVKVVDEPVA